MSKAVLFVIFILFFIALLWQNWIFGLTDQVAATCPAHPTYTFLFTFYLQFSKALNFSSSSWPSSVALREQRHFWQDLQLNVTEHNGCPMPRLGARGWIPYALWISGPSLSAAETEECLQGRATPEGAHGSAVSGIPSEYFISLLKEPHSLICSPSPLCW